MDNLSEIAKLQYEQSFIPPYADDEQEDREYDEFDELDREYDEYRDENYEEESE